MTATKTPGTEMERKVAVRTTADERRSTVIGIILLVLTAIVAGVFVFGVPSGATSNFNLSLPTDTIQDLSLTFNSRLFFQFTSLLEKHRHKFPSLFLRIG